MEARKMRNCASGGVCQLFTRATVPLGWLQSKPSRSRIACQEQVCSSVCMSCPYVLDNEKYFEPFFGGSRRALVLPRVIMGGWGHWNRAIVAFTPFHHLPRPRSSFSGGSRRLHFSTWRRISGFLVRSFFSQVVCDDSC
jgi:hypothetical protein